MALDLSQLLETVQSASNLVLVNPQENIGITAQYPAGTNKPTPDYLGAILPSVAPAKATGHFLFHFTGEDSVSLTSDITDHFVEDNTALQDQIALKPVVVTTQGYIGELNNVAPIVPGLVKLAQDKLQALTAFYPGISKTAQIAYNRAAQAYATANLAARSALSAYNSISTLGQGPTVQTLQQKAFVQFYGYWAARQLFTVQTPWAIFKDMAILSLRAVQDEETRMISTFEITFKKMRFANTITTQPTSAANMSGRAAAQAGAVNDLGVSRPVAVGSLTGQLTKAGFTI